MNESEKEYLEGKVLGLERVCLVLIQDRELWWSDIATRIEWVMGFASELGVLIAGLEESPVILTPRGKGQRDAIAEMKTKLFDT